MREILFRGKCVDNGEWIIGELIQDHETGNVYIQEQNDAINISDVIREDVYIQLYAYRILPNSLGQYTGKKDKNGKRIFEGDILRRNDGSNSLVQYSSLLSRFEMKLINSSAYFNATIFNECEIIGNIYDNPELMEE